MTRSPRRSCASPLICTVLLAAASAAGGCAAPGGLGEGEPAPAVSAQPRPQPLWPAWAGTSSRTPGAGSAAPMPAPTPLPGGPEVGPGGLAAVNARDVVRADRRMRPFLGKGSIREPGRAGLRPVVHADLTGDGEDELVIAADTESGRTALSVYTARDNRIVPILFTVGRRMTAESLGPDLLVRTAADDDSEQAVRYRWDGERMTVVSDERRFDRSPPTIGPKPSAGTGRDPR
ncbi:hypothetical protein [Streptomyces sp. NPDC001568]|uniref:hypothetical protein n=1 Tax=Streptomyces sp. NPDC001568 TaxID=3364588 RepID=UPI0036AAA457